jgi:gamma-tubulin complex component 2
VYESFIFYYYTKSIPVGLEALSLRYVVTWPVSLVINSKALIKYQLLFRFLFYTKHVERRLNCLWLNESSRRSVNKKSWKPGAFALRQRMLNFVQNFQYYVMFEVVEPNWQSLEEDLRKVSTIDDVLDIHTDFLDRCLKDTMLTNTELLRIIHQLLTMCITFSNRLQREDTQFGMIHEDASTDVKLVEELDREFTQHVLQLLKKLQMLSARDCEQQMAHMAARLDYNSFYNTKLERQVSKKQVCVKAPAPIYA